ncbi:hypothetical protein NYE46_20875 [Listeria sp. FSL L8-0308]|nr:hypothetical protein [Paenibacillus polymyxa]
MGFNSASKFIRKTYGKKYGFSGGLGSINLESAKEMKKELVKLDLMDLQNLKGDINAQYDFHKTFSFVFSLMTSFLSVVLVFLTFMITLALRVIDINGKNPSSEKYFEVVGSLFTDTIFTPIYIIISLIVALLILYMGRFMWISRINYIVEGAYELKGKLEENKDNNLKGPESKTKPKPNNNAVNNPRNNYRRKK